MAEQQQSPASDYIRPFYPALDGLRAIAFLLVFLVHYAPVAGWNGFRWGWVGVDAFFVLSGFLITGILIDGLGNPGYVRNFYIRRSLRIFPLFYALWLLLLFITPLVHVQWNRYLLLQALYVGNLSYLFVDHGLRNSPGFVCFDSLRHAGQVSVVVVGHFWSLCVEEQFYLLWPAVVWMVKSRKNLLKICAGSVLLMPLFRIAYIHYFPMVRDRGVIYDVTIFRVDTLLIGAAVALWLRGSAVSAAKVRRYAAVVVIVAPMIFALLYSLERVHSINTGYDYVTDTVGFTLIALAAAAILILAITPNGLLSRILQIRPLSRFGKLSYGMYVIHNLPLVMVMNNATFFLNRHLGFLNVLIPFLFTVIAAQLSFRYIESPFLRLKDVLAPTRHHIADPQPVEESSPSEYQHLRRAA